MKNITLVILMLVFSSNSYAYIDPGSGSLILQGLLAAIASATTLIGIYYAKIKQFFSRKKPDDTEPTNENTTHRERK